MPDQPPNERLMKIEESQAFADHKADQLAQQILALNQRLSEVLKRLAAIEGRLIHAEEVRQHGTGAEPADTE
jgi:uncharacterized coiled-coil protein SlyX